MNKMWKKHWNDVGLDRFCHCCGLDMPCLGLMLRDHGNNILTVLFNKSCRQRLLCVYLWDSLQLHVFQIAPEDTVIAFEYAAKYNSVIALESDVSIRFVTITLHI